MHEMVIATLDWNAAGTFVKSGDKPLGRGGASRPRGGGGGAAGGGLSTGGIIGSVIERGLLFSAEEVIGGRSYDFFGNASIAQPCRISAANDSDRNIGGLAHH